MQLTANQIKGTFERQKDLDTPYLMTGQRLEPGGQKIPGLFGYVNEEPSISDRLGPCYSSDQFAGGIVAYAASTSGALTKIDNCVFGYETAPADGQSSVTCLITKALPTSVDTRYGGIGSVVGYAIGASSYKGTISNCTNYGTVTGSTSVGTYTNTSAGGVAGYANYQNISDVRNEGNVNVTGGHYTGGIAGYAANSPITVNTINTVNKGCMKAPVIIPVELSALPPGK